MTLEEAIDKLIQLSKDMMAAERPMLWLVLHAIEFGQCAQVIVNFVIEKITGTDKVMALPEATEVRACELYEVLCDANGTDKVASAKPGMVPWILIAELVFSLLKRIWENRQEN